MPKYTIGERLKHAWNAFANRDPTEEYRPLGVSYSTNPNRVRFFYGHERSIVSSIYNRIAIDCAQIDIKNVRLDENDQFIEVVKSSLNDCLTLSANKDQTGRAFVQDAVMTMLDEGCIAIVPIDTTLNPNTSSFDILSMRVGRITQWYPDHVKVSLYNDQNGRREEVLMRKSAVAIVENPLYSVMNEPNSTLQRLIRKLNLLDVVDEQSGSGKLDMIIQLPYVIKNEARRQQAELRRKDIELQLENSKYGIAYTDGTEKITQLNRSIDNQLLDQVEYLTKMLYNQLGMTEDVFAGNADEKTMLNYYNRTIEPILSAITIEMKRKFLTKTARTQGQSIEFYRDPFKLVPVNQLAEIADKFTRNAIVTSNEFRAVIGFKPSSDPMADELVNSNLYPTEQQEMAAEGKMEENIEDPMQVPVSYTEGA